MLSSAEIFAIISKEMGPGVLLTGVQEGLHPWVGVAVDKVVPLGQFLRDHGDLQLDMLRCVTGLDYPDRRQMCVAYDLMSFTHLHEFCFKVFLPREKPEIASVAGIWRAADWHERECFDLFGIRFSGHPDAVTDAEGEHPRRILLPEDWVGHPLKKDYAFPREYRGIPGSVEIDWAQKANYPK